MNSALRSSEAAALALTSLDAGHIVSLVNFVGTKP